MFVSTTYYSLQSSYLRSHLNDGGNWTFFLQKINSTHRSSDLNRIIQNFFLEFHFGFPIVNADRTNLSLQRSTWKHTHRQRLKPLQKCISVVLENEEAWWLVISLFVLEENINFLLAQLQWELTYTITQLKELLGFYIILKDNLLVSAFRCCAIQELLFIKQLYWMSSSIVCSLLCNYCW